MSAADIDRVQQQLAEMQRIIDEERARHKAEAEESKRRIEMLEGRLQEANESKLKRQIEQRSETQRRVEVRQSTTTTTTTGGGAGGVVATNGSSSSARVIRPKSSPAGVKKGPPSEASDSPSGAPKARFSSGASNGGASSPAAATSTGRPATASASPRAVAPSGGGAGFTTTALQHAWDKFCVKARGEFTVKELSLLSCDTLKMLMEYYNFRDPVEVAQVEAQWALLQEGRDTAYQATPHDGGTKRRSRSFTPVQHDHEFNIDIHEARKPHLSHRISLARDGGPKGSDPNTACERHRTPSPGGKGSMHSDPPTSSDPNTHPGDRYRLKPTGKRSFPEMKESRFEQKVYPRGKGRGHSPDPAPLNPYPVEQRDDRIGGVRKFQVTYSPEHKDRGVRIGYQQVPHDERPRMKRIVPGAHTKTNIVSLA